MGLELVGVAEDGAYAGPVAAFPVYPSLVGGIARHELGAKVLGRLPVKAFPVVL